jgi:hypothetical protein
MSVAPVADLENHGPSARGSRPHGDPGHKRNPFPARDRWLALLRLAGGRPRWLCEGPRAAGGRYSYALRGNASRSSRWDFGDRRGSVLGGGVDGNPRLRLAAGADLRAGAALDVGRSPGSCLSVTCGPPSRSRLRRGSGCHRGSSGGARRCAPLPRLVAGSAIALANILILFSLLLSGVGLWRRMRLTLPLVIAGITVPAVLSGGLLAARFGERALEVPLAALGAAWVVFGGLLLQGRYRPGR